MTRRPALKNLRRSALIGVLAGLCSLGIVPSVEAQNQSGKVRAKSCEETQFVFGGLERELMYLSVGDGLVFFTYPFEDQKSIPEKVASLRVRWRLDLKTDKWEQVIAYMRVPAGFRPNKSTRLVVSHEGANADTVIGNLRYRSEFSDVAFDPGLLSIADKGWNRFSVKLVQQGMDGKSWKTVKSLRFKDLLGGDKGYARARGDEIHAAMLKDGKCPKQPKIDDSGFW